MQASENAAFWYDDHICKDCNCCINCIDITDRTTMMKRRNIRARFIYVSNLTLQDTIYLRARMQIAWWMLPTRRKVLQLNHVEFIQSLQSSSSVLQYLLLVLFCLTEDVNTFVSNYMLVIIFHTSKRIRFYFSIAIIGYFQTSRIR